MDEEPDDWVECKTAHAAVLAYYQESGVNSALKVQTAIVERLISGTMVARAALFQAKSEFAREVNPACSNERSPHIQEQDHFVPSSFWEWIKPRLGTGCADWVAGDFSFELLNEYTGKYFAGAAQGVVLRNEGLPGIGKCAGTGGIATKRTDTKRGRPEAGWWPGFAETLAVYAFECGLPDGTGSEGQGQVIDWVFSRMSERGYPEPSRAAVQRAVNGFLREARAARK